MSDRKTIIMDAARILFWKHGFKRVSVEEICEKAGISKMTFYRYFNNKIELAKTVFHSVAWKGYENFRIILNEETTSEDKIQKILLMKFEGTNDISQEFLMDFYSSKEEGLSEYVHSITNDIWQNIIGDFKVAQQDGLFRKDLNIEFFFLISQKLTDLLSDQNVSRLFAKPQEMIMEYAKLLMYGIAPKKP